MELLVPKLQNSFVPKLEDATQSNPQSTHLMFVTLMEPKTTLTVNLEEPVLRLELAQSQFV